MTSLKEQQKVQERLYEYPYHYVVQYKNEFSIVQVFYWGLNYAATMEFLLRKIGENQKIESIVDIGCGDGRFTRELSECFPNARLTGIDYSERSIRVAQGMNGNIDFRCINILQERISDQFDAATLIEVYEHIEPDFSEKFLQSVHGVLGSNGLLFVTVPHKNVPVSSHHFRHFTVSSLTSELERHFEILEVILFEKRGDQRRKWLTRFLINGWFILNHRGLKKFLYEYYKKYLFFVRQESECQRIYVKCRKR